MARQANRKDLTSGLRARRAEIEEAISIRVSAVADPNHAPDLEYTSGLRAAIRAAVDYGLAAIELEDGQSLTPPPQLRAQARLAARSGIGLDTVLRRYFAGQAVIADFIVAEAERTGPQAARQLKRLLRAQAAVFDRLVAAVTEEHCHEMESGNQPRDHRADLAIRLIAGEPLDASALGYPMQGHHLGVVAAGIAADAAIREVASHLDRNLLLLDHEGEAWAWLGGRCPLDPIDLRRSLSSVQPANLDIAIGEPGEDLGGWRLTHRQAKAALPVADRGDGLVRYSEVALLTAVLRDDVLMSSLRTMYLDPLKNDRDAGAVLRETLSAYFATDRNAASTAAVLGVSRQTITNRLRTAEVHLARPISECATELEIALRL